jgi:hypothetical protein
VITNFALDGTVKFRNNPRQHNLSGIADDVKKMKGIKKKDNQFPQYEICKVFKLHHLFLDFNKQKNKKRQ